MQLMACTAPAAVASIGSGPGRVLAGENGRFWAELLALLTTPLPAPAACPELPALPGAAPPPPAAEAAATGVPAPRAPAWRYHLTPVAAAAVLGETRGEGESAPEGVQVTVSAEEAGPAAGDGCPPSVSSPAAAAVPEAGLPAAAPPVPPPAAGSSRPLRPPVSGVQNTAETPPPSRAPVRGAKVSAPSPVPGEGPPVAAVTPPDLGRSPRPEGIAETPAAAPPLAVPESAPLPPAALTAPPVRGTVAPRADLREAVFEQVVGAVRVARSRGRDTLVLRLQPPELGEVAVRLVTTAAGVSARFTVNHPAVRAYLEANGGRLEELLRSSGLELQQTSVYYGGQEQSPHRDPPGRPSARRAAVAAAQPDSAPAAESGTNSGLDLKV